MKLLKYLLFSSTLLAMVFACKVGKQYQRPEFEPIDEFYGADTVQDSLDTAQQYFADLRWHEFFDDSVLVSLIDTALVNNIDMQKAATRIEISVQNVKR